MGQIEDIRAALLKTCDEHYSRVFWQDRGGGLPDSGKLIREGIRAARKVIEEMPAEGTPPAYLAALKGRIEAVADTYRLTPCSQDGWHDEDSWIVGGINTIATRSKSRRRAWPARVSSQSNDQ
jgi:hypothetical protein